MIKPQIHHDLGQSKYVKPTILQNWSSHQGPFQEPKLEVPTVYKAYIRPM